MLQQGTFVSYKNQMKDYVIRNRKRKVGMVLLSIIVGLVCLIPILFSSLSYGFDKELVYASPSFAHWFGCDAQGRDVLYRVFLGGRISLLFAFLSALVCAVIACCSLLAVISKRTEMVVMRCLEIVQVIPYLPFVLMLSYLFLWTSPGVKLILGAILIGLLNVPMLTRVLVYQFHSCERKDYFISAVLLGANRKHLFYHYYGKEALPVLGVTLLEIFASSLMIETSLSFLGMGVPYPHPSWGNMMQSAASFSVFISYPWNWFFPGLLVFLTILSLHLIKESWESSGNQKSKL